MKKYKKIAISFSALVVLIIIFGCKKDNPTEPINQLLFTKQPTPVWEGMPVAGDPTVFRDGDTLRMYYTSLFLSDTLGKLIISGVKSTDGLTWQIMNGSLTEESIALDYMPSEWDKHLETAEVIKSGNDILLYYSGYPVESQELGTVIANGEIGLASSTDGITFERVNSNPILTRGTQDAKDFNALFSPTVIYDNGTYYMLYTGWCIDNCNDPFIGLLGATSSDGINWVKQQEPILFGDQVNLEWVGFTLAEADLVKGPNGKYYLFFTGENGIGVAKSDQPFGPWDVYPYPILVKEQNWESSEIVAPSVIIENGKVRLWYMGVVGQFEDFSIGYAEADFPLEW
jgi:predicted GH43/DUF377 family glycosyl hydrolase